MIIEEAKAQFFILKMMPNSAFYENKLIKTIFTIPKQPMLFKSNSF